MLGLVLGVTPARAQTGTLTYIPKPAPLPVVVVQAAANAAVAACSAIDGCRGAVTGAAEEIGRCLFFAFTSCDMPWENRPDQPPNGDQPLSGNGSVFCQFGFVAGPMSCTNGAVKATWGVGTVNAERTTGDVTQTLTSLGAYGSGLGFRMECDGGGNSAFYNSNGNFPQTISLAVSFCAPGKVRQLLLQNLNSGTVYGGYNFAGTHSSAPADPQRQATPFARCADSAGTVVYVAGSVVTYQESAPRPALPVPACPSQYPFRLGGGVVEGNPWSPGQIIGTPGSGPAGSPTAAPATPPGLRPMGPPVREPLANPDAPPSPTNPYPKQPAPVVAPMWNPDPSAPLEPLPNPDGTPGPAPAPGPNGYPCMWGGYAVNPSDCDPATEPAPQPTPPPTAAPEPAPTGAATPPPTVKVAPDPTPDPADGTNCISRAISFNPVTWVYVPVKCALQWAFVPSQATTAKLGAAGASLGAKAPASVVRDSVGFVDGALTASGSECWVIDVDLPGLLPKGLRMLDSCNGPVEAQLRRYRSVLEVLLYVAVVMPLAWWAWGAYAPGSKGLA